jgi:hypothetical protein
MHVFTSVTANYLPKAAALAHSVKRVHPESTFHCLLSDDLPSCPASITEPFDNIINIEELGLQNLPQWIFRHRIVELCTAVKGTAFQYIAQKFNAERIYYFDPDIIVFNRLDDLQKKLDKNSILLTPHITTPETNPQAILDNEHCCLRHGVYNLGFLGIRMQGQGTQFINWWADRLRNACYDDVPAGLFTDQRWVDLAPGFFDDIAIVRDPQYNVATWNLTHRTATGTVPYGLEINGNPLVFYHFSGFDSGAQKIMLERYAGNSRVLFELRDWYIARCEELGQSTLGKTPCVYGFFSNGQPVTTPHRLLYRQRPDLMNAFPDPYDASNVDSSYFHWFQANGTAQKAQEAVIADLNQSSIKKLIKAHAPEPALRLARSMRKATLGLKAQTNRTAR